jgi:hypothetical protein
MRPADAPEQDVTVFRTFEQYKRTCFPDEHAGRRTPSPRQVALAEASHSLRRIAQLLSVNLSA